MTSTKSKILSIIFIAVCLPGLAGAASLAVTNASFEDNVLTTNWADAIPNGWNSQGGVAGTAGGPPFTVDAGFNDTFLELSSAIGSTGGDGLNYLGVRTGGSATGGFIFQDLGVAYQPNTTYTVDILVSRRGGANTIGAFGVSDGISLLGTPGFVNTNAFTIADTFLAVSSLTAAQGNVASFTTGAAVPAGNVLLIVGAPTGNMVYDLVSVDASPIPEPSALVLIAMMGLGFLRRRR